jgi:excisionase family DNA binding protein
MEKQFLTIKEVAEILKVNPETVRKKLRNGHIPGFKLGKDWRVS